MCERVELLTELTRRHNKNKHIYTYYMELLPLHHTESPLLYITGKTCPQRYAIRYTPDWPTKLQQSAEVLESSISCYNGITLSVIWSPKTQTRLLRYASCSASLMAKFWKLKLKRETGFPMTGLIWSFYTTSLCYKPHSAMKSAWFFHIPQANIGGSDLRGCALPTPSVSRMHCAFLF